MPFTFNHLMPVAIVVVLAGGFAPAAAQESLPLPRITPSILEFAPSLLGPRSVLVSAPPQAGQPQQVIDESVSAPVVAGGTAATPSTLPAPLDAATIRTPPHIVYDTDRDSRRMYATGSVNLLMVVQNPADKCLYEIPLCIPACVTGAPTVHSFCGLFGRGVVEYCWPGGFRAIVKFRKIGDVRVDYEGD